MTADEMAAWLLPLAEALDLRFALRAPTGELMLGDSALQNRAPLPIKAAEETVAYLHVPLESPTANASALAGVLTAHAEARSSIRDLAHALANSWKETNFSFDLARWLGGVFDVRQAADVIVRQLCEVQRAERVSLHLVEGDRLELLAAHPSPSSLPSREAQNAMEGREVQLRHDGERLHVYSPLWDGDHAVGVLHIEGAARLGHSDHLKFLASVSTQITLAVRHRSLLQQAVVAAEMRRELELAREIQRSLLPREAPCFEGGFVMADCQSASFVGGDGYDFAHHSAGLDLMIADVSGHGVGAGLVMTHVLSMVRSAARATLSPVEIADRANRFLCQEAESSGLYMTGIYARFDPGASLLHYVTMGHPPLLLYRRGEVQTLPPVGGLPLGMVETMAYEAGSVLLQRGDRVLFYTDGFLEARSPTGEPFGLERIRQVMARELEPQHTLQALFDACATHATGAIADDRTAIVLALEEK